VLLVCCLDFIWLRPVINMQCQGFPTKITYAPVFIGQPGAECDWTVQSLASVAVTSHPVHYLISATVDSQGWWRASNACWNVYFLA